MLEPCKSFQAADWTSPQKIGGRGFAAAEIAGVRARAASIVSRSIGSAQRRAGVSQLPVGGGRWISHHRTIFKLKVIQQVSYQSGNRGKRRGGQPEAQRCLTILGRYGISGWPGMASLEPR